MKCISFLLAVLLAGCVSARQHTRESSWCGSGTVQGAGYEADTAEFIPVRADRIQTALARLEHESIVNLTSGEAASFIGYSVQHVGFRLYLARAAVFLDPTPTDYGSALSNRSSIFRLWYADKNNAAIMTVQTGVPPGIRARNLPVILKSHLEINRVIVACYG